MSNADITVSVEPYLNDCPPWDIEIDQALLPEIAAEICRRFDCTQVFDQVNEIACQLLRERGMDPSPGESENNRLLPTSAPAPASNDQ